MRPPVETAEVQASFRMIDLVRSDEFQRNQFKRHVASSNGLIEVPVHPYYREDDPSFPHTDNYRVDRDLLLLQSSRENVPRVVFEESPAISRLAERLSADPENVLYVIPTYKNDPLPNIPNLVGNPNDIPHRNKSWDYLCNMLVEAGVRLARVGGRKMVFADPNDSLYMHKQLYLYAISRKHPYARDWVEKGVVPIYCPGMVVERFLEHGIDVQLSSVSSPEQPFVSKAA